MAENFISVNKEHCYVVKSVDEEFLLAFPYCERDIETFRMCVWRNNKIVQNLFFLETMAHVDEKTKCINSPIPN